MNSLSKLFEEYLKIHRNISGKTLRNYRADLLHFLSWSFSFLSTQGIKVNDVDHLLPHFNAHLVAEYKGVQLSLGIPGTTTNRRLSTLRNFSKFLVEEKYIQNNPMEIISNLKTEITWANKTDSLLTDFASHLERDGVTDITARNYLSDVRQFLAWCGTASVRTKDSIL